MDIATMMAKMTAQVEQARESVMAKTFGWAIEVDELTAYVKLSRPQEPARVFLLRATFDEFPRRAPSYTFVDLSTKQDMPAAWPPHVMHSESRICTPGTREFHESLHLNDAKHPWDPDKYTFLNTVRMIHRIMSQN